MINFNKEKRLFHITNNNISYYIYANSAGYLETVYFGEFIDDLFDLDGIRKANQDNNYTQYFSRKDNKEYTHGDHFKSGLSRLEVSPHGLIDKRGAPVIIPKNNGDYVTNFLYSDFEIIDGIIDFENIPHAKENNSKTQTLHLILKDEKEEIYLHEYLTIYDDKDIIIKNFVIENKTSDTFKISIAFSLQLDLPHPNYDLHHFTGRWAKERDEVVNRVVDCIQEVSTNTGRSSHEENPFVFLKEVGANYEYGEVIGFNLIYSGNFKFRTFSDTFGGLHILYGINDEDFTWNLNAGERFVTPQAVISYSNQGIDKMSQNFHSFIKDNLITYKKDKEYKSLLFNSWEGCFMDFNTESILSYIDDSKKIDTELFVLDDGWFGRRNNEYDGLGDWWVNKDKIDLHKVIDRCHKNNMKFGIWFEPEMVNPYSDLCKNNPSFVLGNQRDVATIYRHQFHLDFANPDVVDNIFNQMCLILDEYDIDYIKWDHNRIINEHFSSYYDSLHQGEIYHRLVLGYYSLLSRLVEKYPHIMFEGCASGGGRFDLGTLYYCPQIWASDETDPIQRIFIQYNTSLGYPLSTIGSHVSANKMTSFTTKAHIALFGTYGCEMNPNKLNEKEINELKDIAKIYKKYHLNVIGNGDLYHIASPNTSNFICLQSVSKSKEESLVLLMNKLNIVILNLKD